MSAILSRLLTNLDMAVLARNDQGRFSLLNEPPSWLTPLWPETLAQRDGLDPAGTFLFIEDFLDRAEPFWQNATSESQLESGLWTEKAASGETYLLEATALQVDDEPILLIGRSPKESQTDIYQLAREQRLEFEQLTEEINKREVLLHCIVHDLSNPLAGISGSLRLLSHESDIGDDVEELLRIGLNQTEKMQRLIKSILDTFSKDVAGLLPTLIGSDTAPDLHQTASNVVDALQAQAKMKDITLTLEGDASNWQVVGEPDRLERVLFNLLTNAIRHSPADAGKQITLRLSENERYRRIEVEDEGKGVPEDIASSLFTRFGQGDGETGLAGLGLYFCRITVESWGGHIGYEPGSAGGACFWFSLPKPLDHLPPPSNTN